MPRVNVFVFSIVFMVCFASVLYVYILARGSEKRQMKEQIILSELSRNRKVIEDIL